MANFLSWHYAQRRNCPFVVSPRGMLEPWALANSREKKQFAWRLYQERILRSAKGFAVTSNDEALSVRRLGFSQPIAVIPNGIGLPNSEYFQRKRQFRSGPKRVAIFLSRIHPKKGLLELVQAWRAASPVGWEIRVAGYDEGGYLQTVREAVDSAGLRDTFRLVGPVEGDRKSELFAMAELFILPTHSENFGIAIAEALAHGVPVITTKAAPWLDIERTQCGWWVEQNHETLANAIRLATKCSTSTLLKMGERGVELIAANYSWGSIGKNMKSYYEWLIYGTEKPSFVV